MPRWGMQVHNKNHRTIMKQRLSLKTLLSGEKGIGFFKQKRGLHFCD